MNFRKLPREKRNQLIGVALVTLLLLIALGPFRLEMLGVGGLISYQRRSLERLQTRTEDAKRELKRIQDAVKRADQTEAELAASRQALGDAEADVASGDLYSWVINTLRQFKAGYKVEIPAFQPIGPTSDVTMLPNFPYKQAVLSVSGTAHFHDFGRFLADLENKFPHIRVANLGVELNLSPTTEEKETVTFHMDVVTLVKANPS